ncbi:MAG TPA: type 4a pilus biogenesis protein PilO [Candidatus Paceibacterota bacterium]|nr:type 4a pilus biogenesis protein PilO [Candidatus Paceibacterota bacterium]
MKPSTYRLISILGSIGLLIGAVVVYSNFVAPTYSDIQVLKDKQLADENLLADQKDAINAVKKLLGQYQSLTDIQNSISMVLPSREEVPLIVQQIQGIAGLNSMTITALSLQYPPIKAVPKDSLVKPVSIVRITVKFTGDYRNLKSYLEGLETNIRLMDVNSLTIDGGGTTGKATLNYSLILDAYYQ